jgi:hypothetical protein
VAVVSLSVYKLRGPEQRCFNNLPQISPAMQILLLLF